MDSLAPTILYPLLAVWGFVTLGFLVSITLKRNDIADVMWGPGIAIASHVSVWSQDATPTTLQITLLALVTIWALRLGYRIGRKNFRKPDEDPRYQRWREAWTWFYTRSYAQVFLLQGFLMLVLAYPVLHTTLVEQTVTSTTLIVGAALLWSVGFFFEVVGDWQLDQFISNKDNRGTLMRYGLWRYSRHPNYFGEITMWWALGGIVTLATSSILPLVSPLCITLLICYVSGVPLLESAMEKYDEWTDYRRKTSMIIPLPPRS